MQCAALSTRSGAISAPLQNVPREPMIVTTDRAAPSSLVGAPPTIADADSSETDRKTERASTTRMAPFEPCGRKFVNAPHGCGFAMMGAKPVQILLRPRPME